MLFTFDPSTQFYCMIHLELVLSAIVNAKSSFLLLSMTAFFSLLFQSNKFLRQINTRVPPNCHGSGVKKVKHGEEQKRGEEKRRDETRGEKVKVGLFCP